MGTNCECVSVGDDSLAAGRDEVVHGGGRV